jgi:phosphopantothenoylcysteine decarboxylase/phosphopantothenate--cysteine ligase
VTLAGRNVVLCVTGSISAYKAADLASKLVQAGAVVDVCMTGSAQRFIAPFTFRSLTGRAVYTDMFEPATDEKEEHIALARLADVVVIAPASATTLARIANGLADDSVSLTVLATKAPVLVAPAMDSNMWEAAATQANVITLRQRGVSFVGPAEGRLASGHSGRGRLAEPQEILDAIKTLLGKQGALAGRRLVVSAGGTREPIDPVRFISNYSSGKMGYAIAEAARDRGAKVTLVTAASLPAPHGVDVIEVKSVSEMQHAVLSAVADADALVMAAAVSDFRPASASEQKIKKQPGEEAMTLELVKTDDILASVPDGIVKVGFAAETQDLIENAARKLQEKRLDLICANDVTAPDAGFGVDTNRVTILDRDGGREDLPLLPKYDVAMRILDRLVPILNLRRPR